jgi:hypothetical protein
MIWTVAPEAYQKGPETPLTESGSIHGAVMSNLLVVGDGRRLQQCSSPSPGLKQSAPLNATIYQTYRHDSCTDETTLDSTTGCREHFRGLQLGIVSLEHKGGQDHAKGEEETNTNDDSITYSLAEGRGDVLLRHVVEYTKTNDDSVEELKTGSQGEKSSCACST